jgi:hypothetical protein
VLASHLLNESEVMSSVFNIVEENLFDKVSDCWVMFVDSRWMIIFQCFISVAGGHVQLAGGCCHGHVQLAGDHFIVVRFISVVYH